jgi:hypothetical protein
MHDASYKKGYQDGFEQGVLIALASNTKSAKEKESKEDVLSQKKKARDWAVSMGYIKTKK